MLSGMPLIVTYVGKCGLFAGLDRGASEYFARSPSRDLCELKQRHEDLFTAILLSR
jgi:hypothetical protein